MNDLIYCAIGDVHGELERLKTLHEHVLHFVQTTAGAAPIQFVHLGDLVDRGPDSCGVVEYLKQFEAEHSPQPVTLRGNHEQMMIDAYFAGDRASSDFRFWLVNGGASTEASYDLRPGELLREHIDWMRQLPTLYEVREAGLVFVHAGIDPVDYPDCGETVHMWTRRRAFMDPQCWTAPALEGMRVIHGHTPTHDSNPERADEGRRVNIDTGAVYGGQLTAILIQPGKADKFLHS